jgi:hypothetical protein
MSSYSPPVLGFDTYTPSTPAVHTVERPGGILGMAFATRRAEEEFAQRLMQEGGLRHFALSDPDAFAELYPNIAFLRN